MLHGDPDFGSKASSRNAIYAGHGGPTSHCRSQSWVLLAEFFQSLIQQINLALDKAQLVQ